MRAKEYTSLGRHFIQNDVKFIIIGTFFLYFGKKHFLCSQITIKQIELWQKIDKN